MDELTDIDLEAENQPVALLIPPVEIVPFPNFNNLQLLMPHKIQVEDLMGFDEHIGPAAEHVDQNIQIGMVQIAQPLADPIFGNLSPLEKLPALGPSPQALRYWVKYFSEHTNPSNSILIPDIQMIFFTFLLLQSPTFDQTKDFLQSKAWEFFGAETSGNATLFSLPSICPSVNISACSNFETTSSIVLELHEDDQTSELEAFLPDGSAATLTPKKRKARAKGKAPISEDDVRRSTRLKKQNKGFKSTYCKDKNCLGCSSTPPSISPKIIKNFGASFCGMDPAGLTAEKFNAQPSKKKAVGKEQ